MDNGLGSVCQGIATKYLKMEGRTRDRSKRTRDTDMEFTPGQTDESSKAGGTMESSMVSANAANTTRMFNMVSGAFSRSGLTSTDLKFYWQDSQVANISQSNITGFLLYLS